MNERIEFSFFFGGIKNAVIVGFARFSICSRFDVFISQFVGSWSRRGMNLAFIQDN